MAHFAKLDENNIVVRVHRVDNNIATSEEKGVEFLQNIHKTNSVFKQTSYNTRGGIHLLGGTPFRKNFAGLGYEYDVSKDAFIPPKPYPSWTLNETTCLWDPPIEMPINFIEDEYGQQRQVLYIWNESMQSWDQL